MQLPRAQQLPKREDILTMSFVERVYTMLEDAPTKGFDDIIRWESDGRSFKVHKVKEFEAKVQPIYLKQTRIRSFQRKLIAHGFSSIPGGPARGAYHHDKFIRDQKELFQEITKDDADQKDDDNKGVSSSSCSALKPGSNSTTSFMQAAKGMDNPAVALGTAPLSTHFIEAAIASQPPPKRVASNPSLKNPATSSPLRRLPPYPPGQLREGASFNSIQYQQDQRLLLFQPHSSSMPLPESQKTATTTAGALPTKRHNSDSILLVPNFKQSTPCFLLDEEQERPPACAMLTGHPLASGGTGASRLVAEGLSTSLFSMDLDDIVMEEDTSSGQQRRHEQVIQRQEEERAAPTRRSLSNMMSDHVAYAANGGVDSSTNSSGGTTNSSNPMGMSGTITTASGGPHHLSKDSTMFGSIHTSGGSWCDRLSLEEQEEGGGESSSSLSSDSGPRGSKHDDQHQEEQEQHPQEVQPPPANDNHAVMVMGESAIVLETFLDHADQHMLDVSNRSDPFTPRPIRDATTRMTHDGRRGP